MVENSFILNNLNIIKTILLDNDSEIKYVSFGDNIHEIIENLKFLSGVIKLREGGLFQINRVLKNINFQSLVSYEEFKLVLTRGELKGTLRCQAIKRQNMVEAIDCNDLDKGVVVKYRNLDWFLGNSSSYVETELEALFNEEIDYSQYQVYFMDASDLTADEFYYFLEVFEKLAFDSNTNKDKLLACFMDILNSVFYEGKPKGFAICAISGIATIFDLEDIPEDRRSDILMFGNTIKDDENGES